MKVLLIQLRRVGDILLTTPAISYVKKGMPEASIDFLADPLGQPLLETHPDLQNLLIYDKNHGLKEIKRIRQQKYDLVFDFMGNPRSALLTGLSGAKWKVGYQYPGRSLYYNERIPFHPEPEYVAKTKVRLVQAWLRKNKKEVPEPDSYLPQLTLTETDKAFANEWAAKENPEKKPLFLISPASRRPIRQWRTEGYRQVAKDLVQKKGARVILAWAPGEEKIVETIREGLESDIGLMPPTSLRQMAAIFQKANGVLSTDSGATHLAISVGTPTATIYGPTRSINWNPSYLDPQKESQNLVLSAPDVACLGCHYGSCPVGHLCMTHLSEDRVFKALSKFL